MAPAPRQLAVNCPDENPSSSKFIWHVAPPRKMGDVLAQRLTRCPHRQRHHIRMPRQGQRVVVVGAAFAIRSANAPPPSNMAIPRRSSADSSSQSISGNVTLSFIATRNAVRIRRSLDYHARRAWASARGPPWSKPTSSTWATAPRISLLRMAAFSAAALRRRRDTSLAEPEDASATHRLRDFATQRARESKGLFEEGRAAIRPSDNNSRATGVDAIPVSPAVRSPAPVDRGSLPGIRVAGVSTSAAKSQRAPGRRVLRQDRRWALGADVDGADSRLCAPLSRIRIRPSVSSV